MDVELKTATEGLYRIFKARPPRSIAACPCCVDEDDVRTLTTTPLRELSATALSSYVSSLFLTAGGPQDYKYFLPRIFDLAPGDPSWASCTEVVFDKLGRGNWQDWPETERKAVQAFIDAWFEVEIHAIEAMPDYTACGDEIDALVCGLALAGADLKPYLTRLLESPAALRAFYYWNQRNLDDSRLSNAFWTDRPQVEKEVAAFLRSGPVRDIVTI